jgi:hypothetical protein
MNTDNGTLWGLNVQMQKAYIILRVAKVIYVV